MGTAVAMDSVITGIFSAWNNSLGTFEQDNMASVITGQENHLKQESPVRMFSLKMQLQWHTSPNISQYCRERDIQQVNPCLCWRPHWLQQNWPAWTVKAPWVFGNWRSESSLSVRRTVQFLWELCSGLQTPDPSDDNKESNWAWSSLCAMHYCVCVDVYTCVHIHEHFFPHVYLHNILEKTVKKKKKEEINL